MKKLFTGLLLVSISYVPSYAYTEHNIQSANFLATQGIINNNSFNPSDYNLDSNITRREMLKVMMNVSGKSVPSQCDGKFSDVDSSDWGCKYAEAALREGYIAANATFRPNDNVTQIEALKMIMQANSIQRDDNTDWRAGYVSKANSEGLLVENYLAYDDMGVRGWIFSTSARSYSDFSYTAPSVNLTPEEEELFNFLLDL